MTPKDATSAAQRLSWPEVGVYVRLIADFFDENGRDPTPQEYPALITTARLVARYEATLPHPPFVL